MSRGFKIVIGIMLCCGILVFDFVYLKRLPIFLKIFTIVVNLGLIYFINQYLFKRNTNEDDVNQEHIGTE